MAGVEDAWRVAEAAAKGPYAQENAELRATIEAVRGWAKEELPLNPDTEWFKGYEAALQTLLSLLDKKEGTNGK